MPAVHTVRCMHRQKQSAETKRNGNSGRRDHEGGDISSGVKEHRRRRRQRLVFQKIIKKIKFINLLLQCVRVCVPHVRVHVRAGARARVCVCTKIAQTLHVFRTKKRVNFTRFSCEKRANFTRFSCKKPVKFVQFSHEN